jgi:hypothetical protein
MNPLNELVGLSEIEAKQAKAALAGHDVRAWRTWRDSLLDDVRVRILRRPPPDQLERWAAVLEAMMLMGHTSVPMTNELRDELLRLPSARSPRTVDAAHAKLLPSPPLERTRRREDGQPMTWLVDPAPVRKRSGRHKDGRVAFKTRNSGKRVPIEMADAAPRPTTLGTADHVPWAPAREATMPAHLYFATLPTDACAPCVPQLIPLPPHRRITPSHPFPADINKDHESSDRIYGRAQHAAPEPPPFSTFTPESRGTLDAPIEHLHLGTNDRHAWSRTTEGWPPA